MQRQEQKNSNQNWLVAAHSAFVKIKFKMVKQQWQFVCVRHHFKLKNRTSKCGWARAGNTKGGSITIPLTSFFWLVWNQLYDYWQFLFLLAKQTNSNQSNRRSIIAARLPPLVISFQGNTVVVYLTSIGMTFENEKHLLF